MRLVVAALVAAAVVAPGEARAQVEPGAAGAAPVDRVCAYEMLAPEGVTNRAAGVITLHDRFRVRCSDGAELRANTGVINEVTRIVNLTGNVFFQDLTRTLTSDAAVYEASLGRLYATGNVVFTDRAEGTSLRGPELEYFRAMEGRPEPLVNAARRPHLTLARPARVDGADAPAADSAAAPLEIDGDRMTIVGQDHLSVIGNVVIEDPNMRAVAGEAEHHGDAETLELRGNAEIHSRDYSLVGETIFATVPEGSLRQVDATGKARLTGEDLDVQAPRISLQFAEDLLQRSVAWSDSSLAPGERAVANSPTFRIEGDSIDADLPGQSLRTVVAIGNARGESIDTTTASGPVSDASADSAAIEVGDTAVVVTGAAGVGANGIGPGGQGTITTTADSSRAKAGAASDSATGKVGSAAGPARSASPGLTAEELVASDWIVGDTITGYFARVPQDSSAAQQPEPDGPEDGPGGLERALEGSGTEGDSALVIDRLVALGAARSLYHVAPEAGSAPDTPRGINFLSAAVIELRFANGAVAEANVEGLREGIYLEPLIPDATLPADADPTAADADSTAVDGAEAGGDEGVGEPTAVGVEGGDAPRPEGTAQRPEDAGSEPDPEPR